MLDWLTEGVNTNYKKTKNKNKSKNLPTNLKPTHNTYNEYNHSKWNTRQIQRIYGNTPI